jgi:hypothetical protein
MIQLLAFYFWHSALLLLLLLLFYGASDRFRAMTSPNFFLFGGFSWGFKTNSSLTGWGCQPHAQHPTWRTRVSPLIRVITFGLSGMGAPASSYATAGIALRVLCPRHYFKVGIATFGGDLFIININMSVVEILYICTLFHEAFRISDYITGVANKTSFGSRTLGDNNWKQPCTQR